MRWRPVVVMLLLALAALGIPGLCGPTWAHFPFELEAEVASASVPSSEAGEDRRDGTAITRQELSAAQDAPGISWWALAAIAGALALGWRAPRRAAVAALALLLAVFAFEDGLHSVHHGLDQAKASSCPMAAASTHLSATPVDGNAPDDVILPVVAVSAETSPADPIARPTNPEQGRAPPPLQKSLV